MRTLLLIFIYIITSFSIRANEWKILKPQEASKAYEIAANEFQKFYNAVTGEKIDIIDTPEKEVNLIVIGSDIVNRYTRDAIEKKIIKPLNLGAESDSYRILSAKDNNRDVLFLVGGNGRSTLYAVYDFFERQAGCRYFWDGDIIPKANHIQMTGLDIAESPRFMYRGLRYFAHRSLTRFQAEHWGPDEWEKEINWIVKKRLNLFMLRIGMDDIFQKAFPDIVPYPPTDKTLPEALPRSFYDRTTAWPLKYRGELRKHILSYARDRELIHPEDMGTMTHWYSCTPKAFLEAVKPTFNPQSGGAYLGNPTNAVWDIRDDKNLDNYWKLTQAHIDNYGSPNMFHTIGIAERETFDNREDNLEMKLYAYRRIINKLREHYQTAPVLIASWDFYLPGWKGKEINKLLKQLNPSTTIILDYTSDLPSNETNTHFENWGVVNKFPYTFGIFHAYEWENELRGHYDLIKQRMPVAAADPMCKGFVFWPETSHSDPLMLDFFTHNAWNPDILTPEEILPAFCKDRYGKDAEIMLRGWTAAMPVIKLVDELPARYKEIWAFAKKEITEESVKSFRDNEAIIAGTLAHVPGILRTLAGLPYGYGNKFIDRDAIDLARTITGRQFTAELHRYAIAQADYRAGKCKINNVRVAEKRARAVLYALRDILALHDDYSMNASLKQIESVKQPINPAFEQALKGNSENDYCRSYISEYFDYYYLPQFEHYTKEINKALAKSKQPETFPDVSKMDMQYIVDAFYNKPLKEMKPLNPKSRTNKTYRNILDSLAQDLEKYH
ncbi:alpha-N-acetylglucosaminidase TIM-barrel domain-containing protein [Parabacteroides bouchesdurhonensis]|uniref:alpha-N-acetylglucosaminidase TIM-barrel domain-containing protein n=1 Tax=Parabacteroides bouchesdurhonensis TaxID=1936995 RepID=UPI000C8333CF|nr:alpha-N-acetylglucosaminidase TIM-barrel domain-containing protein [Parabacteroides bouchesdurhonensis]